MMFEPNPIWLGGHQSQLEDFNRTLKPTAIWGLRRYQSLSEDWNRTVELDPSVQILEERGNFKVTFGDHQGALEDFNRALELDPCAVGILRSRGNVKVAFHDHQGALEDFNTAHELVACDVGILRSRGNVKVALQDHQGALKDFDRAHELNPANVGILESRGNVKVALHDHQGALKDFDRAHKLDPCDVWILESRGNVKVALHDHQGALEDFDRAHELDPCHVGILESRGNVKVALHDHQGALEDYDRAHELNPCHVGIIRSRGNVKVALHDHQGALEDYDRAHELSPCHVGIIRSRGNVKVALHDHQGALEDFKSACELVARDVGILRSRANVKMTLHDHQGALQDLERVHELDSFDVETLRLRGHVKRMMGNLKGSIMDWAMAHGLPYDDIVCFGNRAFVKRRLENYDGVVGELNHKQEFDFLLSLKKLILQLVVFFVVIVIFVFEYLMGYVERGQWGTYSNGTWEFRATYVCIELRLGSYPFQKFRERPPSCGYTGIRTKEREGKNGKYIRYEPYLKIKNKAFYFRECKTLVKAAFTYDIAKLCLGVKDGNFNMLCPQRYDHLQKISIEGHIKKEISKIVFECVESTFQSIKDHPTNGDNQKILKLFEDGGEGCATNVHQMTLNENLASLGSNGGDDHATRCSIDFNAIEALLNSPNDGDVPAIDIDEHAQGLGESTGILQKDIQYPNLPNGRIEPQKIQSPTEIGYSSFRFRAPPGLQTSLHEIYTKLRTFVDQNWKVALYRSVLPTSVNTVHQTVEGCSETSSLCLCVQKSGDIESISLSAEMISELEVLRGCGWTEGRSEEES